jgi:hypothetical protein
MPSHTARELCLQLYCDTDDLEFDELHIHAEHTAKMSIQQNPLSSDLIWEVTRKTPRFRARMQWQEETEIGIWRNMKAD